MKRLSLSVLCLSLFTLSAILANAQNWPSFRGPNASGVAEGTKPPTTWDVEKSQNVLWKTTIPGLSHASPIVWDNQIFVITAVSSDAKAAFVAKDSGIDLANDDAKHIVLGNGLLRSVGLINTYIRVETAPTSPNRIRCKN